MKTDPVVKCGVGVIVKKGDCILVGKRKGSHGEGLYCFPGGHYEWNDLSIAKCGERETQEETGIICKVFSPDGIREELFTTFDILSEDGSKRYVTTYLIANYIYGGTELKKQGDKNIIYIQPLEPNKCDHWMWVNKDELCKLVSSEKQRVWMPIQQVLFYLLQLEGTKQ